VRWFWRAINITFKHLRQRRAGSLLLVAHFEGWEESDGIADEIKFFQKARKPIWDVFPENLVMSLRVQEPPARDRFEGLSEEEHRRLTNDYLNGNERPKKRIDQMTLAELRIERAHWDKQITDAPGWGGSLAAASEFRDECDKWIRRREGDQFAHGKNASEHGGTSA
jgi:hypothetical protein